MLHLVGADILIDFNHLIDRFQKIRSNLRVDLKNTFFIGSDVDTESIQVIYPLIYGLYSLINIIRMQNHGSMMII